ncbi:MAG: hypothetical protein D6712_08815 [Chloroflexi bacterium]|nr:MAG: hypothetical protein D6712_08815 [Chloroflexota bacterium]
MRNSPFQVRYNREQIDWIDRRLRKHMARFGYTVIDTPIIDQAALFLTRAGDQIIEKLYTFEYGGQQLALRPEFTAAAAYRYLTTCKQGEVVHWQFSGPVFEDEAHNIVRGAQRYSTGAECIGMNGRIAEAEIIGMAALGLQEIGLENYQLELGHVGLLRQLLAPIGLDNRTERFILARRRLLRQPDGKAKIWAAFEQILLNDASEQYQASQTDIDQTQQMVGAALQVARRSQTMGGRSQDEIARRLVRKQQRAALREQVAEALKLLTKWVQLKGKPDAVMNQLKTMANGNEMALKTIAEWESILHLLPHYGITANHIVLHPDLARSWDYYSGLVFELWNDDTLIGGGGRYDDLIRLAGHDAAVPAVGFAYYTDVLARMLQYSSEDKPCLTLLDGYGMADSAIQWAMALRAKGYCVVIRKTVDDADQATIITLTEDGKMLFDGKYYALDDLSALEQALWG